MPIAACLESGNGRRTYRRGARPPVSSETVLVGVPESSTSEDVIEGRDIVCLSFVGWDDYWGTAQQLMSRFAARNRVLFVNPPVSAFSFFTESRGAGYAWQRLRQWLKGPRLVAPNVYAATPPPALPFRYRRLTNRVNSVIMGRWLRKQAAGLGFRNPIVWSFLPSMPPRIGSSLRPALSVYHCVDDFASVPHWWNAATDVRARDAECCTEADVVLCTGRQLAEARRSLNSRVNVVLNGADVELFSRAVSPETNAPADIASISRPVVGFSGVIDFRFDTALLTELALRRPDWSIALVGHTAPGGGATDGKGRVLSGIDLSGLLALPNVHLLGWKPIEALPGYLKGMDVCLIPYVRSEFTRHIFPLKLFEYMAAGKPIVATDLEELLPYAGHSLTLAGTPSEFHDAIVNAIEDAPAAFSSERAELVQGHSWDKRVEQIDGILGPLLAGKDAGRWRLHGDDREAVAARGRGRDSGPKEIV